MAAVATVAAVTSVWSPFFGQNEDFLHFAVSVPMAVMPVSMTSAAARRANNRADQC